jgi:LAO/AO transport system kinase
LKSRILAGDTRAIARAATFIENASPMGLEVLSALVAVTGRALTIGITGPPGAGKSTLATALTATFRKEGKKVGILAVDPSSSVSDGAILGDRIRMQEHHADAGVFIRSMATRGNMGGLAETTFDLSLLLDAAGFEVVLIETVGVGQDEVDVAGMADVTIVVLVPGLGDDVQALKAGLMEAADVFAVNKADLPGAERLEHEILGMQSLADATADNPHAPIVRVVATERKGIEELIAAVRNVAGSSRRRKTSPECWKPRVVSLLRERLLAEVPGDLIGEAAEAVAARQLNPDAAVDKIRAALKGHRGRDSEKTSGVEIDHLGIAVESIDAALRFYQEQLGIAVAGRETVASEQVDVAMLPAGSWPGSPRLELLEAAAKESAIAKFIEKRGPGLHHLALKVDDLTSAVERLKTSGARILNEPRTGAGGHLYVFVHPQSTGGILLELIQK